MGAYMSLADMPPQMRRKVVPVLVARMQEKEKKEEAVTVDGIKFRNEREAARYLYLRGMAQDGKIMELHIKEEITLAENMRLPGGGRIKAVVFTADFSYIVAGSNIREYETMVNVSQNTRAMLKEKGIRLREVF